jgi:photosystem II stability/assembly factor-like uncharacterized protein
MVVFSGNAGLTWDTTQIDTMFSDEVPTGAACIGGYLVVISETTAGLHYASIADILAGTETWTEVATGFAVAIEPYAISSAGPRATWIVGEDGYIYFAEDPTAGVVAQDEGVATSQDLQAVHAYDRNNVLAVGVSNAVVFTDNGGDTWQAVTGPAVGVTLNTCWMLTATYWMVGDAGGDLWYTPDAGQTWVQVAVPGTPTAITDIKFVDDTVGYLAITVAGPAGKILRTMDGGASWYILPEKTASGTIPANDQINSLAPCPENHNVLYAGGLSDASTDGILLKAA